MSLPFLGGTWHLQGVDFSRVHPTPKKPCQTAGLPESMVSLTEITLETVLGQNPEESLWENEGL